MTEQRIEAERRIAAEPVGAVGDRFVVHMDRDSLHLHEAYRKAAAAIFPVISETNLLATLGILARTVAPCAARPGA